MQGLPKWRPQGFADSRSEMQSSTSVPVSARRRPPKSAVGRRGCPQSCPHFLWVSVPLRRNAGIPLEPLVARNKRGCQELGTRDNHPVSWIVVQSGQFHGAQPNGCIDWQEMQTAQGLASRHPLADWQTQLQSPALNEKRDLPRADRRNPQPIFGKRCLYETARPMRELGGPGHPPDPGVRVQQERPSDLLRAQTSASQSLSPTGSVGSS